MAERVELEMAVTQLTIVGAGLIGGSIGLGMRAAAFARRIVAIDVAPQPERTDVADLWLSPDDPRVSEELGHSDLVVLCTPVRRIAEQLPSVLDQTRGVVTDAGSTKAALTKAALGHPRSGAYVPGHPMAGAPTGGVEHASADLFRDRRWLLVPGSADAKALSLVTEFVTALGATVSFIDADEHDRSVALTSHVPQVVASALSVLVHDEAASGAAGPGFASTTRVAGGADAMWRDIFTTNAAHVGRGLEMLGARLSEVGRALSSGNAEVALQLLDEARKAKIDKPR